MAAVALAAAVALTALTTGCGSSDSGGGNSPSPEKRGNPGTPATQGTPVPPEQQGTREKREKRGEQGKQEGSGKGEAEAEAKAVPKVPRAQLTPATGTFTKKEKTYLVGRVPEGMDPAAFLEAGHTACARIGATAKVSEKDAVSALRAGEIDNAQAAVKHLCPTYAPLLKKAGNGD